MGAIPGLLGFAGGVNGTGMPAPAAAPINNPVQMNQLGDIYQGNQQALQQQQALLNALQQQGGIQNQSNVYGQFQNIAAGRGPNPAQAMLNQATGQNVANQAALMAGQRGSSSNVGLMARQAAQQGGNLQQQAVGQGATLQAQQALNALNSAGNMANAQVANQIGATNANTAAQQNEQAQLYGVQGDVNKIAAAQQGNINNVYGQLANTNMQGQQGMIGGIMKAIGSGASMMGGMGGGGGGMAEGGDVESEPTPTFASDSGAKALEEGVGSVAGGGGDKSSSGGGGGSSMMSMLPMLAMAAADGGDVSAPLAAQQTSSQAPSFAQFLKGATSRSNKASSEPAPSFGGNTGAQALYEGASSLGAGIKNEMAQGYYKGGPSDYRSGGKVNAKSQFQKASKKGDSYANDKIPAVLSEHEIVLPRTVTLSKDPIGEASKFVAAVIAKRRAKR